jgi:hypothetical protein
VARADREVLADVPGLGRVLDLAALGRVDLAQDLAVLAVLRLRVRLLVRLGLRGRRVDAVVSNIPRPKKAR